MQFHARDFRAGSHSEGRPGLRAVVGGRICFLWLLALCGLHLGTPGVAVILWSDLGTTLVHDSGPGADILGGAVRRDNTSSDTLYFKFHVDPISDVNTEEYLAGFQLFEGQSERLAVGNSSNAWAYSAFNTAETGGSNKISGDFDLNSSRPESTGLGAFKTYELPRRGIERTIVFKVQYVSNQNDLVTVYLNPDLGTGATEPEQPESLITRFTADASFDQIHLRHAGGGGGWTFSDMAIATSFSDFVSGGSFDPTKPGNSSRGALSFSFRSWQREQGLPQNLIRALAQTRDGYLWLGTDDGVARFDGVRFVSFGWREGLRTAPVKQLFEDSQGALWIASVGAGLTRFADGAFTSFTMRDGLPSDSVTALGEDGTGRLWVGTEGGLACLDNGWKQSENAAAVKGHAITALFKDAEGVLWVGAAGAGIFRIKKGAFSALNEPAVENLLQDPHCLLVDKSGRFWVGAGDDFLLCREGKDWRRYRIPRHLARPYVSSLAESPDGTIWAGSLSEGLFQFKDGKLLPINASSGMLDNFVEALLSDHEGNLWVGTSGGLSQLRRKKVSCFSAEDGLGYGEVDGMCEIGPGRIWAVKPADGLYRWDGRTFSRQIIKGFASRDCRMSALLLAKDGTCWLGGSRGLLRFTQPREFAERPDFSTLPD
ncbi:MAG TPA: two-component regulator propeller domain-containing protein, partial [Candidatus Dormibacteraeota bacterium]|nr:two-component regulator propeller domain-containing protein [Candidatus Dormibacteraeota bacterium]